MRLKQSLTNKNDENKLRAIESHLGFVRLVAAEVLKIGIPVVLSYKDEDKNYWLKSAYKRVLNFAEECQLRMITQKVAGEIDIGENLAAAIQGLYAKRTT